MSCWPKIGKGQARRAPKGASREEADELRLKEPLVLLADPHDRICAPRDMKSKPPKNAAQ